MDEVRMQAPGGTTPSRERSGYPSLPTLPSGFPRLGEHEVDLAELLRQLWRRKFLILSFLIILPLVAALALMQVTPKYTARAMVLIDSRKQQVVNVEQVLSGLGADYETIQSEIQVIRSRQLAAKVIDELGLMQDEEFNPTDVRPGLMALLNPMRYVPEEWRGLLLPPKPPPPSAAEVASIQRTAVINRFLGRLQVTPEGRSRVIAVSFTSESPRKAALIANKVGDLYLLEQLEAKYEATRRATQWLNARVEELRSQVETAEAAVEEFRNQAGLIRGEGATIAAEQVSEINTQLILAKTERAEAEARLRQVRDLLRGGGVESAAEVLSSQLIQSLREQEAEVQRRAAELATEFGPKHPKMINVRAEIEDLREKIAQEVTKIVENLRNEVAVAQTREATLQENLDALKQEVGGLNTAEVRLRALEREANASRALFDTFLSRLKETTSQEEIQQADARVISPADTPLRPSSPRTKLILAATIVLAGLLGATLALLLERLDRGFRSSEQLESLTGIVGLGLIPFLPSSQRRGRSPEDYVVEKPTSAFAEALRTLHTSLLLSNVDEPPKTVLVTSSVPLEGKSTVSLALARLMARSGHRVLLVDTDLRKPRIHRALGLSDAPGVVEVLMGKLPVEEAVQADSSGLHVLTAGSGGVHNSPDLLGSAQMRRLLAHLKASYDLVILDSPPVLVVSDARILSPLADATVFVIRWANTRREVASQGLKQLSGTGGHLAGAVLSQVNVRKHAGYRYGDSGYYHGAARKYYSS